ncbi:MAG TPA: hypothetical protein VJY15_02590 [Candidatus Acidoferrum sp.]|nr:hypothetical protein [Candidatus Acidoferrum sp.]
MAEDTTNLSFAPGQRGAGQGSWQYTGHRSYTAKSIAFINFDTLTPNPPKVPPFKMGTQTIAQTIQFKDNPDEGQAPRKYNLPIQLELRFRRAPCRVA